MALRKRVTVKSKPRGLTKRLRDPRGRKAKPEVVRVVSCGPDKRKIRFLISEDIVNQLCIYAGDRLARHNFMRLRLKITRWPEFEPSIALLQIAPLSYEPTDPVLVQYRARRQFQCEVNAAELGVLSGIDGQELDFLFDDMRKGVLVQFREEDMAPPPPPPHRLPPRR